MIQQGHVYSFNEFAPQLISFYMSDKAIKPSDLCSSSFKSTQLAGLRDVAKIFKMFTIKAYLAYLEADIETLWSRFLRNF